MGRIERRVEKLEERLSYREDGKMVFVLVYIPSGRDGDPPMTQPTEPETRAAVETYVSEYPEEGTVRISWMGDHFVDHKRNVLAPYRRVQPQLNWDKVLVIITHVPRQEY